MAADTRTDSGQPGQAVDSADSSEDVRGQKVRQGRLPVSEMLFDRPGAASPFGEDVTFPLPPEQLGYELPPVAGTHPEGSQGYEPSQEG